MKLKGNIVTLRHVWGQVQVWQYLDELFFPSGAVGGVRRMMELADKMKLKGNIVTLRHVWGQVQAWQFLDKCRSCGSDFHCVDGGKDCDCAGGVIRCVQECPKRAHLSGFSAAHRIEFVAPRRRATVC